MKKIFLLVLVSLLFLCTTGCNNGGDNDETNIPSGTTTETMPTSTEPKSPYRDTHELSSYAGIVDGHRFSGDIEITNKYSTKSGDVFMYPISISGFAQDVDNPSNASPCYPSPPFLALYYDNENKRYIDINYMKMECYEDGNGYYTFDYYFGNDYKTNGYFVYSNTPWLYDDSGWYSIETDGEYIVYLYGSRNAEKESGQYSRVYWKKDVGLLGFYSYMEYGEEESQKQITNIRFTSKTDDNWNMAETIVPTPAANAEPKWPEKLWPEEYKGLDDPELRAILEEY